MITNYSGILLLKIYRRKIYGWYKYGYCGDLSIAKEGLVGVVEAYLKKHSRPFSFYEQNDYSLALQVLENFRKTEKVQELLILAVNKTGDGALHRAVVDYLLENAISYDNSNQKEEMIRHKTFEVASKVHTDSGPGGTKDFFEKWVKDELLREILLGQSSKAGAVQTPLLERAHPR